MGKAIRWVGFPAILFITSMGWVESVQCHEKYPSRAIDIICPFAAGGAVDVSARILADYLKGKWGVPINVVNKIGGATIPASVELYNATPDGYTLYADNSATSMLPISVKNLPFKIMDRTFIATLGSFPMVFIVPSRSPFTSMKLLEAEAKRSPQTFTWTTIGGAGSHDFAARQFFKAIAVDVSKTKPVSSKGGIEAVALTSGGNVVMGLGGSNVVLGPMKSGFIKPLAISGDRRCPDLPDVPTAAEVGYPTISFKMWNGLSGPSKLPSSIVQTWDKALQEMVKDPKYVSRIDKVGIMTSYRNASGTREYVMKEIEEVKDLWGIK